MKRYADENAIANVARRAAREAVKQVVGDDADSDPIGNVVERHMRAYLAGQRTAPELVGRQVAADIMGIQSAHVSRYVNAGRLPEPLEVEGTAPVYLREEVEALAVDLRAEREAREAKRAVA